MQREYKVQKGESLQDVVVKLYGSLEYQTKFLIENNLLDIDISQSQLYKNDDKVIAELTYFDFQNNYVPITTTNVVFSKKNKDENFSNYNPLPMDKSKFETIYYCMPIIVELNNGNYSTPDLFLKKYNTETNESKWTISLISTFTPTPPALPYEIDQTLFWQSNETFFPFSDYDNVFTPDYYFKIEKIIPYFEPFTVVYDDSIIKSIVPAITPSQMETESNLKKYKSFSKQSFFDVSLITTGGLNNIISLAYQNDIDINTFDSAQTPSISYYIDEIENRINYNFMQTLKVKPATAIQLETFVPPTPGTHIAFNESFSNSFN
jgi:hypothetical protein